VKKGKDAMSDDRPDVVAVQEVWNECLGDFSKWGDDNRDTVTKAFKRAGYPLVNDKSRKVV